MTRFVRIPVLTAAVFGIAVLARAAAPAQQAALPSIAWNQNRVAAGTLDGATRTVDLDVTRGNWFPDGPRGSSTVVDAFAERGKTPLIPGPLLRVRVGTDIRVRLRNTLDRAIVVHNLVDLPSRGDRPIALPARGERIVRIHTYAAGTYLYWGAQTAATINHRWADDALLSGVIVVDPPGAVPDDHIFVLGVWAGVKTKKGNPSFGFSIDAINGRAWPATERLSYRTGERVTWRFVNASAETHPMHLHGFPFTVVQRGDGTDVASVTGEREVTDRIPAGHTALVRWTADRPGAWMFHCHIVYHVSAHQPDALALAGQVEHPLDFEGAQHFPMHAGAHDMAMGDAGALDIDHAMGGMIVAVAVRPSSKIPPPQRAPQQRVQLTVEPAPMPRPSPSAEIFPGFRYVVAQNGVTSVQDGESAPAIVLTRGVPAAITVVNKLDEATSVHWHGIEVQDSYVDGAGLTDLWGRPSPMVMPDGTFEARFVPNRAGTFMYHTHADDMWQLGAGLAGPLLVLEPGRRFDPATDHVVMITQPRDSNKWDFVNVNGTLTPAPLEMAAGAPQRLRLLNMTLFQTDVVARFVPVPGATLPSWSIVAEDGLDLPRARLVAAKDGVQVSVGQTRDVTFTAPPPGTYTLELDDDFGGPALAKVPITSR